MLMYKEHRIVMKVSKYTLLVSTALCAPLVAWQTSKQYSVCHQVVSSMLVLIFVAAFVVCFARSCRFVVMCSLSSCKFFTVLEHDILHESPRKEMWWVEVW